MTENDFQKKNEKKDVPSEKFIDVEKSIAAKNSKLVKFLPGFIIRYIKRIIHEDELNDAILRNKDRYHLDFVEAAVEEFGVKIKTVGTENIPTEGGVIIVSNHPLGGLDGIALLKVVGQIRKDLHFMVNDILMALKNLETIFR